MPLQITMHIWKTLFKWIPNFLLIKDSTLQGNAKKKVYALDDSLGV